MKKALTLPLFILGLTVVFLAVFSVLSLLAVWGAYAEAGTSAARLAVSRAPLSVRAALPGAILCALVFAFVRIARDPPPRFPSFVLCLGTVFALLHFGILGLTALASGEEPPADYRAFVRVGGLTPLGSGALYIHPLAGSVMVDEDREPPRFLYSPDAPPARDSGAAAEWLPALLRATSHTPLHASAFKLDRFPAVFLKDIAAVFESLTTAEDRPPWVSIVACVSLALFLTSSSFIVRMSRWPVLNILLLFFVWRGAFFVQRLFVGELGAEVARIVDSPVIALLLPSLSLAVPAVAFLIVDLAFVPWDFWKREIEA